MLSQSNGKKRNHLFTETVERALLVNLLLKSNLEMMFCIFFQTPITHNTQLADKSMKELPQIFKHQILSGMNK